MTLTREQIDTATGRELDALIAEHLFGWRWWMAHDAHLSVILPPAESGLTRWNFSEKVYTDVTDWADRPARYDDWDRNGLPRYSTSGDAMLAVSRAMCGLGYKHSAMYCIDDGEWEVVFWEKGKAVGSPAAVEVELPGAVCRAALLAIWALQEANGARLGGIGAGED